LTISPTALLSLTRLHLCSLALRPAFRIKEMLQLKPSRVRTCSSLFDDRQKILSRSLPIRSRFRRAFGAIGMKRIDNFFKLFPPFIQKRKISGITNIPGHTGGINQELPAVFYLKIFFFFSFRIIFSFFLRSSAMIFSFTLEIISKLIRFLQIPVKTATHSG
jgi:hypothetical protein